MREAAHDIARRRADWAPSLGDRLAATLLGLARPNVAPSEARDPFADRWEPRRPAPALPRPPETAAWRIRAAALFARTRLAYIGLVPRKGVYGDKRTV